MNEVFWANAREVSGNRDRDCKQRDHNGKYPICKRDGSSCVTGCRYTSDVEDPMFTQQQAYLFEGGIEER